MRNRIGTAASAAVAVALLFVAACVPAHAQSRHPNAWKTGVDTANFEGDVYSALNLSGEEATQFGRFFSSALYGISLGDAYVQFSEGDPSGALATMTTATAEFAVGLSPWGAPYAAFKLIKWAPVAYVKCLIDFNATRGFEIYEAVRKKRGGEWGLPEDARDFNSERYREWRGQASLAFNQVWGDIESWRDFGAYCDKARSAIRKERLAKWGWWESWFNDDYRDAKRKVITFDEIRTWTFANWEARVVVDVLSNYVPERLEAANRDMLSTPMAITFELADPGGQPVDVEQVSFSGAGSKLTPSIKGSKITLDIFLVDLPKYFERQDRLDFSVTVTGKKDALRGMLRRDDVMDQSRWRHVVEFTVNNIKVDLGTIRVDTGARKVQLDIQTESVEEVMFNIGYEATKSLRELAPDGKVEVELLPGCYVGRFWGKGTEGRPVSRTTVIEVPDYDKGEPQPVTVKLDNASVIAKEGTLAAIRSAFNASAGKLRGCDISPGEFRHAASASLAKADGTVKQADGREKTVRELAREELSKLEENLRNEGKSDLSERARQLRADVAGIAGTIPEKHRGALSSTRALETYVMRMLQGVQPGDGFPLGPTRAIELATTFAESEKQTLDELLGPVASDLSTTVTRLREEADALTQEYEARWALLDFTNTAIQRDVMSIPNADIVRWEQIVQSAEDLKTEGASERMAQVIASLEKAGKEREDQVNNARASHTKLRSEFDSYRTVTLTDAAMVASTLAGCSTLRDAVRALQRVDARGAEVLAAKTPQERRGPADDLAGALRSAEQAFSDEAIAAALIRLGVSPPVSAEDTPLAARVAQWAYRLANLERRLNKALWPSREMENRYREFYDAHRVLLEDPLVTDEILRVDTAQQPAVTNGGWFSGRTWLSPADLQEHARYDFQPIKDIVAQVGRDATKSYIMMSELNGIAVRLMEAVQEDEPKYAAVNEFFREAMQPYLGVGSAVGGSHAELSKALDDGQRLRDDYRIAVGKAHEEARAPFHVDKISDATEQLLAKADAGYLKLVEEYYRRVPAELNACANRVTKFGEQVRDGWSSPGSIETFIWKKNFDELLQKTVELGQYGTGHEELGWRTSGSTATWIIPGVKDAQQKGEAAVAAGYDALYATRDQTQALYNTVFSNKARISHAVADRLPAIASAPSSPRAGTRKKLAETDPALGKIAWSRDGKMIAWHMQPGSIMLVPASGGPAKHIELVERWFGGTGTSPAFSPNGLLLVHEGPWKTGGAVNQTDPDGVTRTHYAEAHVELVFRRADGTGFQTLLEFDAGRDGIRDITQFDALPDGRLFLGWSGATASGYGWLDPDTGEFKKITVQGHTADPQISADGKMVAYTQKSTKKLMLVRGESGSAQDLGVIARDPTISPNGKWIAYCYGDQIMAIPTSGGKPHELFRWSGVSMLSWSPQGDAIACRRFGEGECGLWVTRLQ